MPYQRHRIISEAELMDVDRRVALGVASITRGTLANGVDLDTLQGPSGAGSYRILAANAHGNAPAASSTQQRTLTVINSGLSDAQMYVTHNEFWFRVKPFDVWGNWRRLVTTEDVAARILDTSDDIDDLGPGIYRVNYDTTANALGLPRRVGQLTVMQITDTIRLQKYETNYGITNSNGVVRPYEVWIRGMDYDRNYFPTFTKVFPAPESVESHARVGHTVRATRAKATYTASQSYYEKAVSTFDRPASTTKVMTAQIAREVVTNAMLDTTVTVLSTDLNPGGSGSDIPLQTGDVVTYRDLFYLAMLPSHNQAAEILARAAGNLMSGAGTGREKFLARMNAAAVNWWGAGRVFTTPSGLGNDNQVTVNDLVDLMYRAAPDSFLVGCMGSRTYRVDVTGPNARTIEAVHTVDPEGAVKFPDMVAAKSGTLGSHTCLVMLYRNSNGSMGAAALMGSNEANRYLDMRQIINYAKEGPDVQYLTY